MENTPTNVQGIITQQVNRTTTQKAKTPAQLMQSIVNAEGSKALLENSLKENSGAFAASVIDLYASDTYLQNCAPQAVFAEVLKAVSLKLPINKQLGFAYIIPRRDHGVWKPVFQLGYKGYIQLCMRTGAYRYINAGPVYEGELISVDKLSGSVDLGGDAESDTVIGYFAYMETLNGFQKCLYWSKEKTVLRYLLSHWGVMSTEMETALAADAESAQPVPASAEPIPAAAEEVPEEGETDA